jgi:hypothetical protein
MAAAEVRCTAIHWFTEVEQEGPLGTTIKGRQRHIARLGERVDIPKAEYERLAELGAVQEPGSAPLPGTVPVRTVFTVGDPTEPDNLAAGVVEAPVPVFDPVSSTDEDLVNHITSERLNVDETVALAGGDPVLAQRVIDADAEANDGEPRKTVAAKLQAVIDADAAPA